jgi:hypothetical protein
MDNVTVKDLISLSYEQKPIEFQDAFNALVMDRVVQAVDQRKIQVAQAMFGDQPASEDFDSEQDQEDNLDGEAA